MGIENLYAASIGLALFVIALVLNKKSKGSSDYIFAAWLLLFIQNFFSFFLLVTVTETFEVWQLLMLEFTEASIFLHGPMYFFYTLSLTRGLSPVNYKGILHFLPFLVALIVLSIHVILGIELNSRVRDAFLVLKMISVVIYTTLVLRMVYSHNLIVEDIYSNTRKKYLTWLGVIGWGVLTVWIVAVSSLLLNRYSNLEIPHFGGMITNISLSLLLFIMGFYGVKQPSLLVQHFYGEKANRKIGTEVIMPKYHKSGLSSENALQKHKEVLDFMSNRKPYRDPELTLYTLAEQLELPPNHMSQIINSIENKNFYEFINEYRVNEVKKQLTSNESQKLTLLGIAYNSGFNSKSSFNRTFKKFTGETPTEYKSKNTL